MSSVSCAWTLASLASLLSTSIAKQYGAAHRVAGNALTVCSDFGRCNKNCGGLLLYFYALPNGSFPSSPSILAASATRDPSNLSSIRSSDSFHTADNFLMPQVRVSSPTPADMYDPDNYHLLACHQIKSLLDLRAAPECFNRYEFMPQHFDDFYQSATSALVHHWTRHPAANANKRQDRTCFTGTGSAA
ncbi:hypothetical protein PGTUg99_013880 [Puccinia graminis f. sp. tritici]|uniref:Uncharacterized protein n=1 Tax=Puccinia graminis f. sp. tritici TaxID=56615 RepID=A0A5B0QZD6_PUCGR|nr:hypothetical protein PGTUg99_013880 [Puccinia graminis f. sp. tritici]